MASRGSRRAAVAKRQVADRALTAPVGVHYTPTEMARQIVAGCLNVVNDPDTERLPPSRPTILDPACGDGALLCAAFLELCRPRMTTANRRSGGSGSESAIASISADERLQIVSAQLFGADIDHDAVSRLRSRILELLDAPRSLRPAAARVVQRNFICGDSLAGPDFTSPSPRDDADDAIAAAIDWPNAFPEIAAAGGFDLIVGNPPYLRERDARELFDGIAQSPLGRRWREARMDLWYYFLHRGLDLLKRGGRLSYIVSSYWLASRGSGKMISRLERETIVEEIRMLNDEPVFDGVQGRHMIFRVQRRDPHQDANSAPPVTIIHGTSTLRGSVEAVTLAQKQLFHSGRMTITPPDPLTILTSSETLRLRDRYEVRQGIAENPASITSRVNERFGNRFNNGEGVFVLSSAEVERLRLSAAEQALLRPYFDTRAIGRYHLPATATHALLYLGRDFGTSLDAFPHVCTHLQKFRDILDARRETQNGLVPWWQLHWPREERLFTEPRILSVQMGRQPQFVWAERPTFVGFSVNLVLSPRAPAYSLGALTGILNSRLAAEWFARHAKRRGIALEINGHLLRDFPLPPYDSDVDRQLTLAVRQRQSLDADSAAAAEVELDIERLVTATYGASGAESLPTCPEISL